MVLAIKSGGSIRSGTYLQIISLADSKKSLSICSDAESTAFLLYLP